MDHIIWIISYGSYHMARIICLIDIHFRLLAYYSDSKKTDSLADERKDSTDLWILIV